MKANSREFIRLVRYDKSSKGVNVIDCDSIVAYANHNLGNTSTIIYLQGGHEAVSYESSEEFEARLKAAIDPYINN